MKLLIKNLAVVVGFVLVFGNSSASNVVADQAAAQSLNFKVWLDDMPIGYHRVSINKQANKKQIHTVANFDVRFLFIPVYSYAHETHETWEENCLVGISSTTDDNGDDYFITSKLNDSKMSLVTQDGSATIHGCVRTFAYWDIELLKTDRLLNTQTGEYQAASITDMGVKVLSIDQHQLEARQFRLVCEDRVIDLWYTEDLDWLALESVTESGAVLRYLPEDLAEFGIVDTGS